MTPQRHPFMVRRRLPVLVHSTLAPYLDVNRKNEEDTEYREDRRTRKRRKKEWLNYEGEGGMRSTLCRGGARSSPAVSNIRDSRDNEVDTEDRASREAGDESITKV